METAVSLPYPITAIIDSFRLATDATIIPVKRENEFIGDPAFAEDRYHITAVSAAIKQGVPTGIHVDIDNEGRPFSPTLGVDEYWVHKSNLPSVHKN